MRTYHCFAVRIWRIDVNTGRLICSKNFQGIRQNFLTVPSYCCSVRVTGKGNRPAPQTETEMAARTTTRRSTTPVCTMHAPNPAYCDKSMSRTPCIREANHDPGSNSGCVYSHSWNMYGPPLKDFPTN